jgi:hypothetical protein
MSEAIIELDEQGRAALKTYGAKPGARYRFSAPTASGYRSDA